MLLCILSAQHEDMYSSTTSGIMLLEVCWLMLFCDSLLMPAAMSEKAPILSHAICTQ